MRDVTRGPLLQSVSVDAVDSVSLAADRGLLLEVGVNHCSPWRTHELTTELRGAGLDPERVRALRVRTPLLGRVQSGSGEVFDRATELQIEKGNPGSDPSRGLDPVDFGGRTLLENRADSLLDSVADVRRFEAAARDRGFSPRYSIDLGTAAGAALLAEAPFDRVRSLRVPDAGDEPVVDTDFDAALV